ncbi:MAG TPA: HAMP domain-containing sensor histidine kinase, partial [Erysipelothrix sp.]
MIKRKHLTLGFKIFFITLSALMLGLFTFYGSRSLVANPIFKYIKSENRVQAVIDKDEEKLQAFITDQEIALDNIDDLDLWFEGSRYMIIYIIDQKTNEIIYTNDYLLSRREVEIINNESKDSSLIKIGDEYYFVEFLYSIRAESDLYANYIAFTLAIFAFVFSFYFGIRKITQRIKVLTNEIELIGAGTPDIIISDQKEDELGRLAKEINALVSELSEKNQALIVSEAALKDLVTSLAHDLRTPLTSLIGYLTLLKYENNPQEIGKLAARSEQKALQIKSISDELFSLFSTLSLNEDSELPMEKVYVQDFIDGTIDSFKNDLALKNFTVKLHRHYIKEDRYTLLNFYYMERLFENILSNIRKYADSNCPVVIDIELDFHWCTIVIKNTI